MLDAAHIATLYRRSVAKNPDLYVSDDIKQRESAALRRHWEQTKLREGNKLTQSAFADEELHVTTAYVTQMLDGKRPLRLEHAKKFAARLGCQVRDFSPRLADEDEIQSARVRWPFPTLDFEDISNLSKADIARLEGVIRGWLIDRAGSKVDAGADNDGVPAQSKQNKKR